MDRCKGDGVRRLQKVSLAVSTIQEFSEFSADHPSHFLLVMATNEHEFIEGTQKLRFPPGAFSTLRKAGVLLPDKCFPLQNATAAPEKTISAFSGAQTGHKNLSSNHPPTKTIGSCDWCSLDFNAKDKRVSALLESESRLS
ncbi:hypothetical protein BJ742DRAFT_735670 [Cladochytrium replicatum]|nr:hypothetical protein BJ742DRAFT_735670 [Cladochytrium replicatum]